MASDNTDKPIHSLILDTGPLIKNDPTVSTLLAKAEVLYTIPAVLSEIRDRETRARIDTTLVPFLRLRSPRADSIKFVSEFARKTGDLEALSKPDIHVIALTYEIQCERDGGPWRLKRDPAQKGPNGENPNSVVRQTVARQRSASQDKDKEEQVSHSNDGVQQQAQDQPKKATKIRGVEEQLNQLSLQPVQTPQSPTRSLEDIPEADGEEEEDENEESVTESSSDSEGWITPSNLRKHVEADKKRAANTSAEVRISEPLEAAVLTSDFTMQNVTLRMGLSLLSPAMSRIRQLRSHVLRCHGCFSLTRDMERQFCPRCGQPTLTRVSCSTDSKGKFHVHLKKNFQWNNRGNRYSIPKPVPGSASGKIKRGTQGGRSDGGKNGWGQKLILAEDQKEYMRVREQKRRERRKADYMNEDYLPGIFSGDRLRLETTSNGKIKIGAGRGVNGTRRR